MYDKIKLLFKQFKDETNFEFILINLDDNITISCDVSNNFNEVTSLSFTNNATSYHLKSNCNDLNTLKLIKISLVNYLNEFYEDENQIQQAFLGNLSYEQMKKISQISTWKNRKGLMLIDLNENSINDVLLIINENERVDTFIIKSYILVVFDDHLEENLQESFKRVADIINNELMVRAICCVTYMDDFMQSSSKIKNLLRAFEIKHLFYPNIEILDIDKLSFILLIDNLDHKFLNEQLLNDEIDFQQIDNHEDIKTINCFFENDLNISKTSLNLFIHRNTLIYRLDKYHKISGLDIRKFNDAFKFMIYLIIYKLVK
ncbi:MAG: PucR family transcriptional regulator [Anaerorhabdus sp.]